jgi:hypothetical protein
VLLAQPGRLALLLGLRRRPSTHPRHLRPQVELHLGVKSFGHSYKSWFLLNFHLGTWFSIKSSF